jgi:hypothetical protein
MRPDKPGQPPVSPDNLLITTLIGNEVSAGRPAPWLIEAAASIGLDYSRLTHAQTNHFRTHAMNRHTLQPDDFDRIPEIIAAPDTAIIGVLRFGALHNVYVKRIGGATFIYIDEVLDSRKNKLLRAVTLYKNKREKTLEEVIAIISGNGRTDISKSNIIGAGGHPGGEAEASTAGKPS